MSMRNKPKVLRVGQIDSRGEIDGCFKGEKREKYMNEEETIKEKYCSFFL